jgi:hypothetical protein
MVSAVSTPLEYAGRIGASERTVRRWLADGLVPGAVQGPTGAWDIPPHAPRPVLTPRRDIVPRHDVAAVATVPAPASSPLGVLGTLEHAAQLLGTSVAQVRHMAADPATPFVVRPWGPHGALRVYVAPR